jgi:hypothetical protein
MTLHLFAWVGLDEHGNGEVGIKRAYVNNQLMPLVFVEGQDAAVAWLNSEALRVGLQGMANTYGIPLRLVRFTEVQEIARVEPDGGRA